MRQDLFYRLSTLYLQLPELHERKPDVPLLFNHFLAEYDKDLAGLASPLPKQVVALLTSLSFKGNLRELQSIAARFACLCNKKEVDNHRYLVELCKSCCQASVEHLEDFDSVEGRDIERGGTFATSIKEAEKRILSLSQKRCDGELQLMANQLQLGRTTLWRKLKEHDIN